MIEARRSEPTLGIDGARRQLGLRRDAAVADLPAVQGAALRRPRTRGRPAQEGRRVEAVPSATLRNGRVELTTDAGLVTMHLELRRQPLNKAGLGQVLARDWPDRHLILIPYVQADLGRALAGHHVNFVDLAGNCHIAIGRRYLAHVEGRRPPRAERRGRGLGAAGYRALFALLARPELVDAPVRTIGEAAAMECTLACCGESENSLNGLGDVPEVENVVLHRGTASASTRSRM